ncbi:hypothetical protein AMS68_006885 [Peltaster fructicola]|uniref:Uncharacterized protein n=1 Tax=Peltaster fructicola TaxID=286661 RepID=A0A6H0Y3E9_9PEZI|nr:hypothetical protein AMS68_006885 [Peltaster fructicola]
MEALAALSVASSVVQFVDFSSKIIIEAYERCKGSCTADDEIRHSIASLDGVCNRLTASCAAPDSSEDDEAIARLARQCITAGRRILTILGSVTVKGKPWRAFRMTVKQALKRPEMKQLQKELEIIKSQMSLHMLNVLRDGQAALSCKLEALGRHPESARTEESARLDNIRNEILEIMDLDDLSIRTRLLALSSVQGMTDALPARLGQLRAALHNNGKAQTILSQLRYSQIEARYHDIHDAHYETFQWIFKQETGFSEWLASGRGTYWITGKPGCGKSTLMKFIVDHKLTKELLQHWTQGASLTMASFYFWISGDAVEKTQQGLLRSLVVQVLEAHPHLIERCFPNRWQSESQKLFTTKELMASLLLIFREELSTKFCLFIDGLDEYDVKADKGEIHDLLRTLSELRSTSVKMCVSSRPWTEFRDEFARGLHVHEWTAPDIKLYVRAELREDLRFQELYSHGAEAERLVQDITLKAEGVFLWVFFVVKSLRRGLRKHDDIAMLHRRLAQYPSELNGFFDRMLSEIEDVYLPYTACLLQAMTEVDELPIMAIEYTPLELEHPGYALRMPIRSFATDQLEAIEIAWEIQLHAWCQDLLFVRRDAETFADALGSPIYSSGFFGTNIAFMHRTVHDYVSSTTIASDLAERAHIHIEPWVFTLRTYLYQAKSIDSNDDTFAAPGLLWFLGAKHELLLTVRMAEALSTIAREASPAIMMELNQIDQALGVNHLDAEDTLADLCTITLELLAKEGTYAGTLRYGVVNLVERRFREEHWTPQRATRLLRHLLLISPSDVSHDWFRTTIERLLEKGADVNAQQDGLIQSVWESFIWRCLSGEFDPLSDAFIWALAKLIDHGADLKILDIDVLMACCVDQTHMLLYIARAIVEAYAKRAMRLAPRYHWCDLDQICDRGQKCSLRKPTPAEVEELRSSRKGIEYAHILTSRLDPQTPYDRSAEWTNLTLASFGG